MTSIRLKYRPSSVKGKQGSLYYQIIHNRSVRRLSTGYRLYPHECDSTTRTIIVGEDPIRQSYLHNVISDTRWQIVRFEAMVKTYQDTEVPIEFFIQALIGDTPEGKGVFDFIRKEVDRLATAGRTRSAEIMATTLRSFMRFRGHIDLDFSCFDKTLIQQYEGWLRSTGLTRNTTSFYMRNLRAAYHAAVDAALTIDTQPFRKVYTGVDKTTKRALTKEHFNRILALDLTRKPHLQFARDMFMLSFYMRGIPFVDLAYLRKRDLVGSYIIYRRKKTGQQLTIKWTPEMQRIADKYESPTQYLLPIIMREDGTERQQYQNQLWCINHNLKTIGKLASLPIPLSTYMSRHAWATIARDMNVPIAVISQGLGHDNEKTTQIYLDSIKTSVVDEANRLIIESL